jgi:hypothetical protein
MLYISYIFHMGVREIDTLRDSTDRLDRVMDSMDWQPPGWIRVRNGNLEWGWIKDGTISPRRIRPDRAMFERFLGLASASETAIARYATKWGMLFICEHGLPASHKAHEHDGSGGCPLITRSPNEYWEPIARWRHFSRQAKAILSIAGRLTVDERPGRKEDWRVIFEDQILWQPWDPGVDVDRLMLRSVINEWLSMGRVRLEFDFSGSASVALVRPRGSGLFGALAVQLALAVGKSNGIGTCDGCGGEYSPVERRPKAGQRKFCKKCRVKGIPKKLAHEDYRTRQKELRNGRINRSKPPARGIT